MTPTSSSRFRSLTRGIAAFACLIVASLGPLAAQDVQQTGAGEGSRGGGLLGDDFARDAGAIIVTGQRLGENNLFEPVIHPEDSCQMNAPNNADREPGFAIDASGFRRVRQLERIRRRTRAATIYVTGGSFVGADFRRAKLYNMCFFGTDLSQTNWTGVSAQGLGFVNVDLSGATMERAHLPDVLFRESKLTSVNAKGARFMQGRLDGGWEGSLRGLDLSEADLSDFRIVCGMSSVDGCPIERSGISMARANLRRASFHSFFASDLDLTGARIDQTELSLDHVTLFDEARLVGPIVLRSPRRAMMLFPGEAKQLTQVARSSENSLDVCANVGQPNEAAVSPPTVQPTTPTVQPTPSAALAIVCSVPGSETRDLLRSVAALEGEMQGTQGYESRRAMWTASRDACLELEALDQQTACVVSAYRSRQMSLRERLGSPEWLKDRGYRLFLSREAAFPTDKSKPGLYGRVLPVLLDTAAAAVIVHSDGQGGLHAKGVAADGCYFERENLAYDAGKGEIGFARTTRRRRAPLRMEEALIALSGQSAEVVDAGLVRATGGCGAQNPFPKLEEIQLDDGLLATIWERF